MSDRRPEPIAEDRFEHTVRERASATPLGPRIVHAEEAKKRLTQTVPPRDARLCDVQEWFSGIVTSAHEATEGQDAERFVTSGPHMSATERIDLYRYGYRARLVECLADDYPAMQNMLGEQAFESLCHGYIDAHPSRSPSLNGFGQSMAAFACANGGTNAAFVFDLARLEWALVEMLHAPPAPVLSLEELQAIDASQWGNVRLPPSDTVRILRFAYPVNRYFQAFRDDDAPSAPDAQPSATAIYRRGFTVWRMDLTPAMAGLLEALSQGATLGEALGGVAVHAEDAEALAEAERNVMLWFREWVAGGFFARVELSEI